MKWESIAVAVVFSMLWVSIAVMSYSEEKTKQYRIQYNCPK